MNQGLSTREAFGNDSPAISSCEIFIFKVFKVGDENIVQLVECFPSMFCPQGCRKLGNPTIQEVEAAGSGVQGFPHQHTEFKAAWNT